MFLFILLSITILIFIFIYLTTIKLHVIYKKNDNNNQNQIYVYLYLWKIKYFQIKLDKKRIQKLKIKQNSKEYIKNLKIFLKNRKIIIKNLNIKTEKFNLILQIGTKEFTRIIYLIPFITMMITNFLSKTVKSKDYKQVYYKIIPVYNNSKDINISLNCIISVKVAHIIKVIYKFTRKRGLKYGKTSYRGTHDNCYE